MEAADDLIERTLFYIRAATRDSFNAAEHIFSSKDKEVKKRKLTVDPS